MPFADALLWMAACASPERDPGEPLPEDSSDTGREPTASVAPPSAMQGELIGLGPADDPWIDEVLAGTRWSPADHVRMVAWLSGADQAGALEDAPFTGASVQFYIAPRYEFAFNTEEVAPGEYRHIGSFYPEVSYVDLEPAVIEVAYPHDAGRAELILAPSAVIAVPVEHPAATALVLDATGQGYHSMLVVVFDAKGATTWSNEPTDIAEMYTRNQQEELTTLIVPETAFPLAGSYVVGAAATTRTWDSAIEVMDPTLATFRVGRMGFWRLQAI